MLDMQKNTSTPTPPHDVLVTEREASHRLGLSMITLRKLRSTGSLPGGIPAIPYHKLGKAVRYSSADLDQYVQRFRVTPPSWADVENGGSQ